MLRSANEILGYGLFTSNEDVGTCKDLLFDDRWWTIRHMVANTGGWITGRQILVSPMMITKPDWKTRKIFLNVSKEKIENCPELLEDEPVSREYERQLTRYYGFPSYWHYSGLWGTAAYPNAVMSTIDSTKME